ncbi:MAG TPA: hybrid sensor histidine kinase/response regulator [Xanthobacteraceae bacterium]|nr:hybrid sensor histidine kinase/response regulator [Xanthobacteraceae bacterium]
MLQGWIVIAVALAYIGLLFVVASYGDRARNLRGQRHARLLIYPLCLAIYCTSWTFFGSVGLASRNSFDFLTIYIGPIILIGFCAPLVIRIVRLAKAQNITSIADFIAARYGKAQSVAATVALIAIIGTIPYIALQLKAVSSSLATVLAYATADGAGTAAVFGDLSLFVALSMAVFAILFGTRHIDATEHQDGLMLAIATESIVKLVAFVAVGVFVTFWMFDGPAALFSQAMETPHTRAVLTAEPVASTIAAMTLLSLFAILLLPRQFHVTVVENNNEQEIRRAAWLFPFYLVAINIFVVPIAMAGLLTFGAEGGNSDMFVLALPAAAGSEVFTLIAFVGGLSAATAMVIVETVALAIMVSNDIMVPLMLKRRDRLLTDRAHVGGLLLAVRRIAIFGILFLAYMYYRAAGDAQLASIGLLSFAAVAQLAPAFFGGLVWRQSNARAAMAGMWIGIAVWAYTLFLPSFPDGGLVGGILAQGPFGISWLRPQALLFTDLPALVHGVFWSLSLNLAVYIALSFRSRPTAIERMQADIFVPQDFAPITPSFRLWRSSVTVEELFTDVARYLGEARTQAAFDSYAGARGVTLDPKADADFQLLRFAEHQLASAIGAASSRLVLSLLLRKRSVSTRAALKLLDDANTAIHYNREILQTALDQVRQGIAVFNKDLHLICWNRQFSEILDLPFTLTHIGTRLDEILRLNAARRAGPDDDVEAHVRTQIELYLTAGEPFLERFAARGLIIEVRASPMPDGGLVTTFTDITDSMQAADDLERANESLERRVQERTEQLTRLNGELERARATAEDANLSKTRFLAAASHDILQPLNAARLYVTSLSEARAEVPDEKLVDNIDASLEAVEDILGALLDISRLDAGALRPDISHFAITDLLRQIEVEFAPLASDRGLNLVIVPCGLAVRSDRRLLRRLLQNLVSNAIKYTPRGRVLVGCRRCGDDLRIDVYDTGIGIPPGRQHEIFREFQRLDQGARVARGLGLGLSIVERIARMLDHPVAVRSVPQRFSHFSVRVPLAAAPDIRRPAEPSTRAGPRDISGLHVLCIDNEVTILDGMERLLRGWGCRVTCATSIAQAMEELDRTAAEHGPPDIAILDYHLDGSDGLAAAADLRRRYGETLPAVLVTADRSPAVRDNARALSVPVLHKPVKPAALRALLPSRRMRETAAAE